MTHYLVVNLCILGTKAEYEGKWDDAFSLYWQAWEAVKDGYDACIEAHYVA